MYFYHTLEIEATNYCNANCVFCGNRLLKRAKGFLSVDKFKAFMDQQRLTLSENYYSLLNMIEYPKVNFCGLGDPLLHPQIGELVNYAKVSGFYTQLVSNGICFNRDMALTLCAGGLDEICISLHSVNPLNYKQITGIELDFFIERLTESLKICEENNIRINLWRIHHPDRKYRDNIEDEERYRDFLGNFKSGNIRVLGPSEPWFRDGIVPNTICNAVCDTPLWCNKILFTDCVDWQGNIVLCCNDYNRECVILGNIFDSEYSYNEVVRKKIRICKSDVRPAICNACKRWPDTEIITAISNSGKDVDCFKNSVTRYIEENGL